MITTRMRRRLDVLLMDDGYPNALAAVQLVHDLPFSRSSLPKSTITIVELVEPFEAFDSVLRKAEL